ncbi:hypothetical protein B0H21DRAFT_712902 [Amylocystis lapponica]|nr:hypothetical protein B0H21DRAFT_712902 [Amylocystis lapponica]
MEYSDIHIGGFTVAADSTLTAFRKPSAVEVLAGRVRVPQDAPSFTMTLPAAIAPPTFVGFDFYDQPSFVGIEMREVMALASRSIQKGLGGSSDLVLRGSGLLTEVSELVGKFMESVRLGKMTATGGSEWAKTILGKRSPLLRQDKRLKSGDLTGDATEDNEDYGNGHDDGEMATATMVEVDTMLMGMITMPSETTTATSMSMRMSSLNTAVYV